MSLAVDATHVYWVDQDGSIMWASLADGKSERLFNTLTPSGGATSLAIDPSGVYWTDRTGIVFVGQPTSPSAVRNFAQGVGGPSFGVVLDATSVYWVGGSMGSIYRKPR